MARRRRVSSRLAKKKQKQLTRQILILVGVAVLILALFIFLILPNAVRLFFNLLGGNGGFEPEDTIPPQPPIINAPPTATFSAQIQLKGYAEPESQVSVTIDGQEIEKIEVDDQGEFSTEISLNEGSNLLSFYSQDEAGNQSAANAYTVIMDQTKPEIKIGEPEDGAQFVKIEDQVVDIKGETEPEAKVYINGRLTYAGQEGQFSYPYRLSEGENKIQIRAVDQAGNSSEMELTLGFRD